MITNYTISSDVSHIITMEFSGVALFDEKKHGHFMKNIGNVVSLPNWELEWMCLYCGTPQSYERVNCSQCGAPRSVLAY